MEQHDWSISSYPTDRIFQKLPIHLALSFTNESDQLDLVAIASLVNWCDKLGINFITLYDDLGRLKDRQQELIELVKLRKKETHDFGRHIHELFIISRSDGRPKFVQDIKALIQSKPETICQNQVQDIVGWPTDPDLLIIFGTPVCLYGFPPWQLRLTEIVTIPTHRDLPPEVFMDSLELYSKISQRKGA